MGGGFRVLCDRLPRGGEFLLGGVGGGLQGSNRPPGLFEPGRDGRGVGGQVGDPRAVLGIPDADFADQSPPTTSVSS